MICVKGGIVNSNAKWIAWQRIAILVARWAGSHARVAVAVAVFAMTLVGLSAARAGAANAGVPWVRIYDENVQGVYIDADADADWKKPDAASMVVALSPHAIFAEREPRTRLIAYSGAGNRLALPHGRGCLYWDWGEGAGMEGAAKTHCDRLLAKARRALAAPMAACEKRTNNGSRPHRFFVAKNLKEHKCLAIPEPLADRFEPTQARDVWVKSKLEIENRSTGGIAYGTKDEIWGQVAYMRVEDDKTFSCFRLGTPTTYRRKSMSEAWARTTIGDLPSRNSSGIDAESYRHPSQLGFEPPTWQKQYLIRTGGFRYHCWNASRVIDQPEDVGAWLNDGTALLVGGASVLRIRLADGSTDASASLVRVFDASVVSEVVQLAGGESCPEPECPLATLGGYQADWDRTTGARRRTNTPLYYRSVIQGIDKVLLRHFIQSQK